MIKAKKISFSYGDRKILDNVSMELKDGETTVIIGPSGSGKTTLLKALTLLEQPQIGSIEIDNEKTIFPLTENQKLPHPYPKITVSFQQQFLWPHLTLKENILLPAENIVHKKGEFTLAKLTKLFQMEEFIDRYPNEASLGQRQRVALARALITNPKYLFLDEITTFLDVKQVATILNIIKKLKERGIAIFMITHAMHFAMETADQVIFFDEGKIIEKGSSLILKNPKTKELKTFISYIQKAS